AVIHYRVARATARPAGSGRARKAPRLIAGLLPHAGGVHDAEMRAALDEREALIEARADAVLDGSHRRGTLDESARYVTERHSPGRSMEEGGASGRRLPRPLPHHRRRAPRGTARVRGAEDRRRASEGMPRSRVVLSHRDG